MLIDSFAYGTCFLKVVFVKSPCSGNIGLLHSVVCFIVYRLYCRFPIFSAVFTLMSNILWYFASAFWVLVNTLSTSLHFTRFPFLFSLVSHYDPATCVTFLNRIGYVRNTNLVGLHRATLNDKTWSFWLVSLGSGPKGLCVVFMQFSWSKRETDGQMSISLRCDSDNGTWAVSSSAQYGDKRVLPHRKGNKRLEAIWFPNFHNLSQFDGLSEPSF